MAVSCLLVSFNCAKIAQSSIDLQYFLDSALESAHGSPEFIVVALQEFASILDSLLGSVDEWLAPFITAGTNAANGAYDLVAQHHVGAIGLLVFGIGRIPVLRVTKQRVSFGKFWSSLKGAVCISLLLENVESIDNAGTLNNPEAGGSASESEEGEALTGASRLTFVGAHLAANEGRLAARNHDFGILTNVFDLPNTGGQVFVLGDLNYRASNQSFATDELTAEMRAGRAAWGLTEAPVSFQPSFKYTVNTHEFNLRRSPSWCDRVLFRKAPGAVVKEYNLFNDIASSDHKPVFLAIDTPTDLPSPISTAAVPTSWVPPSWVPLTVDKSIGVTLFVGTTRTGWLFLGLIVTVFFFIKTV